jgi:exonuclease SbcC
MKNQITIKSISLLNFKGIKDQTIEFGTITDIFGANGTGKTTIFDAFTWLLFGKDSTDRKDFEIKTLDIVGKAIPQIDHEVTAVVEVNGTNNTIKRVLRENWVKTRGNEEREFKGNVTEYYWNGVPMQQKEFQMRVSEVLEEGIFKLITNPLAFNAMKWQDRRNILTAMAPISDEELANGNEAFEKLLNDAKAYKSLEEYKKMISASIKKAKEDIKLIPARVDEVSRQKPEALDFVKIQSDLEGKNLELQTVDTKIQNANSSIDGLVKQRKDQSIAIGNLENEITNIESAALNQANQPADNSELTKLTSELENKNADLVTAQNGVKTLNESVENKKVRVKDLVSQMDAKRNQWTEENAKTFVFDEEDCKCPTCQTKFEPSKVEEKRSELLLNFNNNKTAILNRINADGASLKQEKENLESEIKALEERILKGNDLITSLGGEITKIKANIETLNSGATDQPRDTNLIYECILSENEVYKAKKKEVEELKSKLVEVPEIDNASLVEQRRLIVEEIDNLKGQLNIKNQIDSCNDRIQELNNQEKTLSQQIANVEKIEFAIEKFNKLKVDTLETTINQRFKHVKFRMFEDQINGGVAECCDALIDGVPFSDANTASKINAGIDIINTLCEFYQVTAPIFIDNRESIVDLIECESQIVNLIVSGGDKKLRVA